MKIGIIGCGYVGATTAYAVLLRKAATEIVLVDIDKKRAAAEAADISHAVPFSHPAKVTAGTYHDLSESEIVIIAAGVSQKPGESRLQLLSRNAAVMQQIIPEIMEHAPDAIILLTTNPVDLMTHLSANIVRDRGGHNQVIGSGTTLDTARFRSLLSNELGVDAQHVHGYVVGEHGDSEVLTWSIVDIGGLPLDDFVRFRNISLTPEHRNQIDMNVRRAAYSIIEGKGATYYGIGAAVANLVDVIAHDNRAILTICSPLPEVAGVKDVTVSLPHLINGRNIVSTLPLNLSAGENKALARSAGTIRDMLDQYYTSLK